MDKNAVVRLAYDLSTGVKTFSFEDRTYSDSEAVDVLRQALIDANGGSSKFDRKSLRRNKVEIFEIIEELIPQIVNDGLKGSEFWNENVDYRNTKYGDTNEFVVDSDEDFIVTTIANGIATPRRQRINAYTPTSVETSVHAIRIYEEFARFMSGAIDWNVLCNKVARAFQKAVWSDIYAAFNGYITTTLVNPSYKKTGTFVENTMLELIGHVEAATGKTARICGTQVALKTIASAITPSTLSDSAKDDLYRQGYIGMYYGTPVYKIDQAHTPGTDNFMLSNTTLYVVASDDKFIKFVDEGDTIVDDRDYTNNSDMTVEYRMFQTWGVGLAFSDKGVGAYCFSA